MGNHKFKLSDMLPNAWFYKLRDMSKSKPHKNSASKKKNPCSSMQKTQPRSSFYYATESIRGDNSPANLKTPNQPRRSSMRRSKRVTIYKPSPELDLLKSPSDSNGLVSWSTSYFTSSTSDIIIDMNEIIGLPPILTKPAKSHNSKQQSQESINAKRVKSSTGVKLRAKIQGHGRKSASRVSKKENSKSKRRSFSFSSGSLAIVKASFDPQKDFKESMMEMIVENNIKASKELEHLLACYLSLNSDEYHHFIIKAFEQIWSHLHL